MKKSTQYHRDNKGRIKEITEKKTDTTGRTFSTTRNPSGKITKTTETPPKR